MNQLQFVDRVYYINLDHRVDRKERVEAELLKFFPKEKIFRFPAITALNGTIGCSLSHLAILRRARRCELKNILIVEDDFCWMNTEEGIPKFIELANNPFDVIILGAWNELQDKITCKVHFCLTTVGYFVNNHYFDTLIDNFQEGVSLLEKTGEVQYTIDVYWNRLMSKDNWYLINPKLCYQFPGYSDICKIFRDTRKRSNVPISDMSS